MQNVIISPKWFFDPNGPHGIAHTKRVMILAETIAIMYGCNKPEIQILRKAAAYHDIGRENNEVDEKHGFKSVNKAIKLKLLNPHDSEIDDIATVLIHEHSLSDLENLHDSITVKLLNIFKDADALDRVRFGDKDCGLNTKYLRMGHAKQLIGFAKMLLVQMPEVVKSTALEYLFSKK